MASTARIDELKKKFDENPRRYFAPLANEFRKAGEIEQAIMICEEFLPQQPGHMSGHIVYGQALFEAGRLEDSRTVFETALTLDPENLIALRHLGDIARGQGDLEAARRWYDRVLEADPRNDEIQGLIASLHDAPNAPPPTSAPVPEPADSSFAPPAERSAPPSRPSAPPPLPQPIALEVSGDVAESMPEAARMQAPPPEPTIRAERAEGLESVEFTPPTAPLDRAHDLGGSLEPGEFTAPAAPVAPLPGLEDTGMAAFERAVPDGGPPLPMLDTSQPTTRPPARRLPHPDFEVSPPTIEFFVPAAKDRAAVRGRGETSAMPESEPESDSLADTRSEIPSELPPSVIAAEAELMDEPTGGPSAAQAPFVTETMAELFLKQGLRDQALDVYRQLLAANPGDERVQRRVAELQPAGPAAAGASVRDFLARLAILRPGERSAAATPPSDDDFAGFDSAAATPPPSPLSNQSESTPPGVPSRPAPSSVMSTGVERGAVTQGSGGSIDALFGNRTVGTSEDSAASALAQAFGGAAAEPAPVITGRPARAAAGELSLDSVFRDSPPRPPRASQNFSFDQFFSSEGASAERGGPPAPAPSSDASSSSEPAERGADDIEQFNSWLQGLKPK